MKKLRLALYLFLLLFFINCNRENNDTIEVLSISSINPSSFNINDTVLISGKGFDPSPTGNVVTIGSIQQQVLNAAYTFIQIKISANTISGKLIVRANNQQVILTDSVKVMSVLNSDVWIQKQDFPYSWGGSGSTLNGNGFVKGFASSSKGYFFKSNKLWAYDPSVNAWTSKTDLPSSIKNFTFVFTIGTKAFIGMGASEPGMSTMTKEVWQYDMETNIWTKKKDFPGATRVEPFSFSDNLFGYVGGGDSTNTGLGILKDVWKYDPQLDNWSKVANFPGSKSIGISGFSINGKGYVLESGQGNPTAPVSSASSSINLWSYDGVTNTWTQKMSFPTNGRIVYSATIFTIGDKAYAGIGINDTTMVNGQMIKNDFWEYDSKNNSWTKKADVGGSVRWFSSSFSIGTKGYIGLGNGNTIFQNYTDFWQYSP